MISIGDLSAAEREKLVHLLHDSSRIRRHSDLFLWAQGALQQFLPHDILVSISGNFAVGDLSFDVVSGLPGVRTDNLIHCDVRGFSRKLHARWVDSGHQMFSSNITSDLHLCGDCASICDLQSTMEQMKSVLVQGVRCERSQSDALYVMMHVAPHEGWRYKNMFELMLPHIDVASRRISGLPIASASHITIKRAQIALDSIGISPREQEIIEWLSMGKTNYEIGMILNISAFTVKNHLQRIFRKLDVINRVQAVAKMELMTRSTRPS